MSLTLDVVQPTGITVSFWVLNAIHLNALTHIATIQMDGYLDVTSYNAGLLPIMATTISATMVPTNVLPNISIMAAIYAKIQLDPFFSGAVYTSDGI